MGMRSGFVCTDASCRTEEERTRWVRELKKRILYRVRAYIYTVVEAYDRVKKDENTRPIPRHPFIPALVYNFSISFCDTPCRAFLVVLPPGSGCCNAMRSRRGK